MSQPRPRRARPSLLIESGLLVAVMLVAAFLRCWRPSTVPPGPSHDELRMMDLGELIVDGQRPIHWKISYSAEPLFMYLLALAMPVWGFNIFAARLVTRFTGLLLIPAVYVLSRRLFGRTVSLFGAGVLAVAWWPIFFSRVALRAITLPLLFVMAVYCLWRGLDMKRASDGRPRSVAWGWLASAGVLFGLTWYTFTAARGLALLLPALLVHLVITRRVHARRLTGIALVTIGLAALVAAPFVYEVVARPGAPETRLQQLGSVLAEMRAGNLRPLLSQTLATLGMLAVRGDPNWRYNVASRAAFGPVLGVLAMLGAVLCLVRLNRPSHFLLIAWLLLGWAPSILTPEAPSFVRAIGALPAAAILAGVVAKGLSSWAVSLAGPRARRPVVGLLVLFPVLGGLSTYGALFIAWPAQPQVREVYQASLTEALAGLNDSGIGGKVWISEPFPDDRHLLLAKRVLDAPGIELRWFDASRSLILPPDRGLRRYLFADFVAPDLALSDRWLSRGSVVLEGEPGAEGRAPAYRLYEVKGGPWVMDELARVADGLVVSIAPGDSRSLHLPMRFDDTAALVAFELADDRVARGQALSLAVYWQVSGPAVGPLTSFAHLIDDQGHIAGQYDGFDVPWQYWEPDAVIAQVYRFTVDDAAQPGAHWLEVGLYNPDTMKRAHVVTDLEGRISDRLVVGEVALE